MSDERGLGWAAPSGQPAGHEPSHASLSRPIGDHQAQLLDLAKRLEEATGPDRDLDGEIAEKVYGWRPAPCPPDAHGENAGEVLTPDGKPWLKPDGQHWVYPPLGAVHRAYHCEEYTRHCRDPAFPIDAIRKQNALAIRGRALAPIEAFGRDAQRLDGEATKAGNSSKSSHPETNK